MVFNIFEDLVNGIGDTASTIVGTVGQVEDAILDPVLDNGFKVLGAVGIPNPFSSDEEEQTAEAVQAVQSTSTQYKQYTGFNIDTNMLLIAGGVLVLIILLKKK